MVNYGISNTIVLEIPLFTTKPALCTDNTLKMESIYKTPN